MKIHKGRHLKIIPQIFFLIFALMMRSTMASEYQVDIGWVPGFISEYNNAQTYITDASGKVITHFGGRNAAGGH